MKGYTCVALRPGFRYQKPRSIVARFFFIPMSSIPMLDSFIGVPGLSRTFDGLIFVGSDVGDNTLFSV